MKKQIALILFLVLQACSTPPTKPVAKPTTGPAKEAAKATFEQHQQKLAKVSQWKAEGRMAVTKGNKGNNASFVWQQQGDNFQIKLFGPFGSGAVYINGNSQHVELKEADGKVRTARTPEELLQKVAGWQVPLTGLRYWMLGIPTPGTKLANYDVNNDGCLTRLTQDGWHIEYENYSPNAAAPLPSKMQLQNSNLKVKMVIKSWQA